MGSEKKRTQVGARIFDNITWRRPARSNDPDRDFFATAGAIHLAIAMHRKYGLQIMLLVDRIRQSQYQEGWFPDIYHVFAMDAEGAVWDAKGRSDTATLLSDYKDVHDAGFMEASEDDLLTRYMGAQRPLPEFDQKEVIKALAYMQSRKLV
jgi:hypothetical protein